MVILLLLIPVAIVMVGLYCIILGLWELRAGKDRNQYIKYMFTGLFLLVILTPLIWVTVVSLSA
ncbi:hypothetical protein Pryu01_01179 [Paraliobacillus ryukyuensis]|uniref:Uncharacterized protein n=1 Tax=Paraliobacillus ryukyuensis TaxID=200904 RepID=A0A366EFQ3_9BACI|nr:hypothetical protein [Paraliobacillus ryukyuensis]RBP00249.1 hypothetical protein DES48_1029 [Paraliobacillus ryukyuensis]